LNAAWGHQLAGERVRAADTDGPDETTGAEDQQADGPRITT
jgi:hypothetical protein